MALQRDPGAAQPSAGWDGGACFESVASGEAVEIVGRARSEGLRLEVMARRADSGAGWHVGATSVNRAPYGRLRAVAEMVAVGSRCAGEDVRLSGAGFDGLWRFAGEQQPAMLVRCGEGLAVSTWSGEHFETMVEPGADVDVEAEMLVIAAGSDLLAQHHLSQFKDELCAAMPPMYAVSVADLEGWITRRRAPAVYGEHPALEEAHRRFGMDQDLNIGGEALSI